MRGQKVYALIGLITILAIVQLLLNINPTNAYKHVPYCPPWCYMTFGAVESLELTSGPLHPGAQALAVSDPSLPKEKGASKHYAYVYADKGTKVKVKIGHEVYKMFDKTKSLFGFSVIANHKHKEKGDSDYESIPELIAFVPVVKGDAMPPTNPDTAEEALHKYIEDFKKCAQTNSCGGDEAHH